MGTYFRSDAALFPNYFGQTCHYHYRHWAPLSQWSKSAVRQLSMVSHTEDYEYNKIVVGDNTDPNLIWFILNVSGRHHHCCRFTDMLQLSLSVALLTQGLLTPTAQRSPCET